MISPLGTEVIESDTHISSINFEIGYDEGYIAMKINKPHLQLPLTRERERAKKKSFHCPTPISGKLISFRTQNVYTFYFMISSSDFSSVR